MYSTMARELQLTTYLARFLFVSNTVRLSSQTDLGLTRNGDA